jgi:uncharacterized Zn-finger protein
MSSRRKQLKPKSYGFENEGENGTANAENPPAGTLTTSTSDIQDQTPISKANTNETNSLKRKREDEDELNENEEQNKEQSAEAEDVLVQNTNETLENQELYDVSNGQALSEHKDTFDECDNFDNDDEEMPNDLNNLADYDDLKDEEDDEFDESGDLTQNNLSASLNYSDLTEVVCESNNPDDIMSSMLLSFKCKVCGKGFKHRRSLNRHVKLHSGEKNFKCQYCTTAFARSDHLKAHLRTHNNSKPFKCSICQCGYSSPAALKVHIAHHHSKSKFKCILCDNLEFHSQLALEGHIYTKHTLQKENDTMDSNQLLANNQNGSQQLTESPTPLNTSSDRTKLIDINNISKEEPHQTQQQQQQQQHQQQQQPLAKLDKLDSIESNLGVIQDNSNAKFKAIAPKQELIQQPPRNLAPTQKQPTPVVNKNMSVHIATQNVPTRINPDNYCELCNARFSNVESYSAHMRNCHPNITPVSRNPLPIMPSANKGPLNTPPSHHLQNGINQITHPLHIKPPALGHLNGMNGSISSSSSTSSLTSSSCAIANDDFYIIKETHYTCAQCHLTFYKLDDYMIHLKQDHCVEVFRCILCKQMQLFDNLNLLKEHFFQVHQSHKFEVFRCRLCLSSNPSNQFHNVDDLYNHLQHVHHQNARLINGTAPNPIPNHLPPSQSNIYTPGVPPNPPPSEHFNMMNGKCHKRPYCESDFTQSNALNQQAVHSNKPVEAQPMNGLFSCQYCRITFSNKAQLDRHVRIHLSSIDLKCNICDRIFDSQETLAQHKLTHVKSLSTDERNVATAASPLANLNSSGAVCVYCKQVIENELQFKEHFKRHNNIGVPGVNNSGKTNSFMCIVCRQTLRSNQEYNMHMRNHLRRSVRPMNANNNNAYQVENGSQNGQIKQVNNNIINRTPSNNFNSNGMVKDEKLLMQRSQLTNQITPSQNGVHVTSQIINNNSLIMNSNEYLCEICSSKFETQLKLQAHLLMKHEFASSNGIYICPVCDDTFNRPEFLLSHTQQHGPAAKIYKCTQCPLAYVFKSQLINHSFAHQHQIAHKKAINHSPQFNSSPLNHNFKPHPPPHQMSISNMSFSGSNLNNSATQSPGQMNDTATLANNSMVTISENGVKTYTCLTCSKTFASQRNLNVHIRIHTGFRPFECEVCKRKFTRRENLRSHMKCHLNLRPYPCPICNKTFRRRSHVNSHVEVHFKSKTHICIDCSTQFESFQAFTKHILKDHINWGTARELVNLIKSRNMIQSDEVDDLVKELNIDLNAVRPNTNDANGTQNNENGEMNGDEMGQSMHDHTHLDENESTGGDDINDENEDEMNYENDEQVFDEEGATAEFDDYGANSENLQENLQDPSEFPNEFDDDDDDELGFQNNFNEEEEDDYPIENNLNDTEEMMNEQLNCV